MKPLPQNQGEVDDYLKECAKIAMSGTGQHYELYAQRFTDMVDNLIDATDDPHLREYILSQAKKDGDYCEGPGRWELVHTEDGPDVIFTGGGEP